MLEDVDDFLWSIAAMPPTFNGSREKNKNFLSRHRVLSANVLTLSIGSGHLSSAFSTRRSRLHSGRHLASQLSNP